jgi:hypothetical protein
MGYSMTWSEADLRIEARTERNVESEQTGFVLENC